MLLGRNSVGKSTFLRSLPLLRQSIETKSSAPVLWFGDYVDFGDFKSAVTDKDEARSIRFAFELKDYSGTFRHSTALAARYDPRRGRNRRFDVDHLKVSYWVCSRNDKTERDRITIELPASSDVLELEFSSIGQLASSVKLNGRELTDLTNTHGIYFSTDSLFTHPFFLQKVREKNTTRLIGTSGFSAFIDLVEKRISKLLDARFSENTISRQTRRILKYQSLDTDALTQLCHTESSTLRQIYTDMIEGRRSDLHQYLNSLCLAQYLFNLLEVVGDDLQEFFGAVEYIGPARARSERFYRQQELEVSEISPDGKNLPMFLASLDDDLLGDFSSWVKRVFGYGVSVHKTEGHISINLEHRGQSVNVVDTGYGVSQVLPVLAQIWWMQSSKKERGYNRINGDFDVKTLTIEQPELHLHPAHQALLADVFVEAQSLANSKNGHRQTYIVETHSEALINRMGELVEEGQIDATDVQVVIFGDLSDDLKEIDVTIAEFDEKGVLQNWPYGFFNFA
ncbi:AAA family ATPase [Celeribacter halophilus]|uniref:AAA family ATPase n=1 Tax=Celeribacter halophilus TaxID=576117 RepID=UPI003A8D5F29